MSLTIEERISARLKVLRKEIEALFEWVHPEQGDGYLCATGETYVVYSERQRIDRFVPPSDDAAMQIIGALCDKLIVELARTKGKYLYWRRMPDFGTGSDADGFHRIGVSIRICISSKRVESSNSILNIKRPEPSTAEQEYK